MHPPNGLPPPQPLLGPGCFRKVSPGRTEHLRDATLSPPVSVLISTAGTLVPYSRNHPFTHCSENLQCAEWCLPHRCYFLSFSVKWWITTYLLSLFHIFNIFYIYLHIFYILYFYLYILVYAFPQKHYLFTSSTQQNPSICMVIIHISNAIHPCRQTLSKHLPCGRNPSGPWTDPPGVWGRQRCVWTSSPKYRSHK